jgi:hypothetical protein
VFREWQLWSRYRTPFKQEGGMKKKLSRRKFLEAGAMSSAAVIGGMAVNLPVLQAQIYSPKPESSSALNSEERTLLQSAMDEIIPAGDGMPAASEVGSMAYLDELTITYPEVAQGLHNSLTALETLCRRSQDASFSNVTHRRRVEVLTALEKRDASAFTSLQQSVYEAYYTRPAVWKLIGYTFQPTDGMGPPMKRVWNEAVLNNVRKKPRGYREV